MIDEKIKIYFLGSGDIAVPVLAELTERKDIHIAGAGTQIDRPAGRKRLLTPTPVGIWAEQHGFPLDKIGNVNTPEFKSRLEELAPDVVLVISFGQIIKPELLEMNGVVWVNVHASLLPAYRGASPIASAILNRDHATGVSFMRMDAGLDTGPVYRMLEFPLKGNEKADELELVLGGLSARHTVEVMRGILSGELKAEPQDNNRASLTRKIKKEHGVINWSNDASAIEAMIRAYHPWPGAAFSLNGAGVGTNIKIVEARVIEDMTGTPGQILRADKNHWIIACGKGALELARVVPQGKKEMNGADFLRGVRLEEGTVL